MKKLISILLCSVLLSVYFTVFTVTAMADTKNVYSLDELYDVLENKLKDGDTILVHGNGETWYVNKLIYINKSCHIQFFDVNFAVGDDGEYNYYNDSLIEVNQHNTTLDFFNCTFDTDQHDLLGDGDFVCEQYGSIIYVDGNNCVINGTNSTTFIGKTSTYYGGAIYIDGWNNCTIKNITFKDCESSYQGGAIYAYGKGCTIDNCEFSGCKTTINGGAIYAYGTNCTVKNCKFSDCSAPEGGSNVYSYYKGETFVGSCRDANDNDIDSNTCVNCELESILVFNRKNNPASLYYPAYPEDGYYILRSAVDPDYVVEAQKGSINIGLGHVNESQSKLLYLQKYGQGYLIHTGHINSDFIVGGFMYSVNQLRRLPHSGGGVSASQFWNFESDAPGGDDHYYIHSTDGVWMEAALADGEKPHSGTVVQSNTYFGTTNQVWILEKVDAPSGFTLAEGNTWIIAGLGVVAVVVIAVVVAKKKKKAALADGEVTVTENTEKTEE